MKLLVFDVGGTQIKYGLVENGTKITEKGTVDTPETSYDDFLKLVKDVYRRYENEVSGIAMSLPGSVDVENGICGNNAGMRYPHDPHIAETLKQICDCNVVLENDGKAAAIAEYSYGNIKGCQNAAVFLIGTGVGGGLIINNKIVRGPHNMAGEFSFVNTDSQNYNDVSQIMGHQCSTTYLLNRYNELSKNEEKIDGMEFFQRLPEDTNAQKALDDLSFNIAYQLHNLYWLLDLEKVAIGGGISRQAIVIEKIKEKFAEIKEQSFTGQIGMPARLEVVPCLFSNDANLIGAYQTFLDQTKTDRN